VARGGSLIVVTAWRGWSFVPPLTSLCQWLGGYFEAFLKHLPSAGLPRNTEAYTSRLAAESLSQTGAFVEVFYSAVAEYFYIPHPFKVFPKHTRCALPRINFLLQNLGFIVEYPKE